ncbi:MAG: ATP-binding protein [Alphaproteobacteria bacterium]|nr:ATP-binding protein [Alphaproteobacteria bacterium]
MSDGLGLLAGKPEELGQVIDPADRSKLDSFLKAAMARRPAFDRLLKVTLDGRTETLHFGATIMDGRVLVVAARDRSTLARLAGTFLHGASPPTLQTGQPSPVAGQAIPAIDEDCAIYADLARLNNELTRIERQLTKANLQLGRANRELRALYESLPVGIFRANATGRIEQANTRFCTLAGVSSATEWLGRVHTDDAEAVSRLWRETILHGVAFESVHRQLNAGRPPRHIQMKAVALREESDRLVGIVGVAEDVTERIVAEEQQREIERQDAVRQLTGGLAHNLNNILMVIVNSAEQLCDELPPGDELQAAARMNMAATERAALLTRRLMIYAGHGGLVFGRVKVDSAVRAICRDLGAALGGSHELALRLRAPGMAIKINEVLLTETLQELITNAQAAMPQGGTIHIATRPGVEGEAAGRRTVVISVTDSGTGMGEEILKRAKEPFFTTRGIGQGVGLGLSLADGAARIAGGVLDIRSQAGKGTTVELRLPVVK